MSHSSIKGPVFRELELAGFLYALAAVVLLLSHTLKVHITVLPFLSITCRHGGG